MLPPQSTPSPLVPVWHPELRQSASGRRDPQRSGPDSHGRRGGRQRRSPEAVPARNIVEKHQRSRGSDTRRGRRPKPWACQQTGTAAFANRSGATSCFFPTTTSWHRNLRRIWWRPSKLASRLPASAQCRTHRDRRARHRCSSTVPHQPAGGCLQSGCDALAWQFDTLSCNPVCKGMFLVVIVAAVLRGGYGKSTSGITGAVILRIAFQRRLCVREPTSWQWNWKPPAKDLSGVLRGQQRGTKSSI